MDKNVFLTDKDQSTILKLLEKELETPALKTLISKIKKPNITFRDLDYNKIFDGDTYQKELNNKKPGLLFGENTIIIERENEVARIQTERIDADGNSVLTNVVIRFDEIMALANEICKKQK